MENLPATTEETRPAVQQSFFAMKPTEQIVYASEIATVLADVINKQNLYSTIGGKNYVKVEGWQTLGTFLGIVSKERSVSRLSDGSYEAFVDLIKFSDGTIVGGGSALCSVGEKRWGSADEYARRSMAITRATGKAFRSAFSWIVTLAGYEPTPEEEIPQSKKDDGKSGAKGDQSIEVFTATRSQLEAVSKYCSAQKLDSAAARKISDLMMNKPYNRDQIQAAAKMVASSQ